MYPFNATITTNEKLASTYVSWPKRIGDGIGSKWEMTTTDMQSLCTQLGTIVTSHVHGELSIHEANMEYLLLTTWRQNKVRLSDPVQKWPVKPGCTHPQQQTRKKHMYTTTKTSQHRVETIVPRPPSSWWPWPAQMGCTQRGTRNASWSCPPHPWSDSAHLSSEPHRHHEASWRRKRWRVL